jgi:hypothetical protein
MPQSSLAASHLCAFRARASLDHHVVYSTHFLKLSLEYSTDQYIRCAIFLCAASQLGSLAVSCAGNDAYKALACLNKHRHNGLFQKSKTWEG